MNSLSSSSKLHRGSLVRLRTFGCARVASVALAIGVTALNFFNIPGVAPNGVPSAGGLHCGNLCEWCWRGLLERRIRNGRLGTGIRLTVVPT